MIFSDTAKSRARKLLQKARLLTILVIVASLAFMVRVGETLMEIKHISGAAHAEEAAKQTEEAAAKDHAAAAAPKEEVAKTAPIAKDVSGEVEGTQPSTDALKNQDDAAKAKETAAQEGEKPVEGGANDLALPSTEPTNGNKWQDAADDDTEYADIKKEMYQDLLRRREELDDREKKLAQREALIEAAQKEISKKYTELEGLRTEIQGLLKQQTAEEQARIASLVKIYSGMKPKDAARIFNTLDLDILLQVVGRMPEGKASLIIAAMEADRARALTIMLAEQRKLPEMP